jgi:Leucine-rich repeat (LRR) protein
MLIAEQGFDLIFKPLEDLRDAAEAMADGFARFFALAALAAFVVMVIVIVVGARLVIYLFASRRRLGLADAVEVLGGAEQDLALREDRGGHGGEVFDAHRIKDLARTHRTQITDAGLEHLKGLNQLQSLNFARTQITDAGLEHLKGLNQLQTLNLSAPKITDAGLVHLKGLTGLQVLYVSNTKVTDAGVAELQKALPNCKISK